MAIIPLPTSYFSTLFHIHNGADELLDGDKISYLVQQGYVDYKHGGGWMTNSKGRNFMRAFGKSKDFRTVVEAEWPHELLGQLRMLEHNTMPRIDQEKLQKLLRQGYVFHIAPDFWHITNKGRDVLRQYNL